MGFKTDIRFPVATGAFSTTATNLATLTIPAVTGGRVCVTGVGITWETAFTTPVSPKLVTGGRTLLQFVPTTTNLQQFFTFAVAGDYSANLVLTTTLTNAAHTIDLTLLYYIDS